MVVQVGMEETAQMVEMGRMVVQEAMVVLEAMVETVVLQEMYTSLESTSAQLLIEMAEREAAWEGEAAWEWGDLEEMVVWVARQAKQEREEKVEWE